MEAESWILENWNAILEWEVFKTLVQLLDHPSLPLSLNVSVLGTKERTCPPCSQEGWRLGPTSPPGRPMDWLACCCSSGLPPHHSSLARLLGSNRAWQKCWNTPCHPQLSLRLRLWIFLVSAHDRWHRMWSRYPSITSQLPLKQVYCSRFLNFNLFL